MGNGVFRSRAYNLPRRKNRSNTSSSLRSLQRKISNLSIVDSWWIDGVKDVQLDLILNKMEDACRWTEDFTTPELHASIARLFEEVESEVVRLSEQKRFKAINRIVLAMNKLKESLGEDVLKEFGRRSFLREVIFYKKYEISVIQYFKPEPFYKNVLSLLKLYAFVVNEVNIPESIFTYYLEHSNIISEYYVLGIWSQAGHAQLVAYGQTLPKYSSVRTSVLNDLEKRGRCTELEYNSLIATIRN